MSGNIDINRLRELCAKGLNPIQMAERLGVQPTSVYKACERHNLCAVVVKGYESRARSFARRASRPIESATRATRAKRELVCVEHNGQPMSLRELASVIGIPARTIQHRYQIGDRGERLIRPVSQGARSDLAHSSTSTQELHVEQTT